MLAKLGENSFDSNEWLFEIKWDGYRAVAELTAGNIKLYSRNGLSFIKLYSPVANALSRLKIEAVLDGEIVVFNKHGKPDFQQLQQYNGSLPIAYYVFDCLMFNGKSLTNLPLLKRKEILKSIIPADHAVIKYSDHVLADGNLFFKHVKEHDLEGMIAKRTDSLYHVGKRSGDWLKIKNHNTQEAIIVGMTDPRGSREYFGALVLAIREKDHYRYIGHTGTGFTNATLKEIYTTLKPLATTKSPFDVKVPVNGRVTWVQPKVVCELKYTELTSDGIMRHPVFLGLRIDKSARETTTVDAVVKQKHR
jgi:bifunctional non-homologous end joining protein LigD